MNTQQDTPANESVGAMQGELDVVEIASRCQLRVIGLENTLREIQAIIDDFPSQATINSNVNGGIDSIYSLCSDQLQAQHTDNVEQPNT